MNNSPTLGDSFIDASEKVVAWLNVNAVEIVLILTGAWLIRHFGARIIGTILARTVRADLYPSKSDREKRIKTLNGLANAVMRIGVYIIAGLLLVSIINEDLANIFAASAGLLTVAIGFGAKDLINDFIRGIFIISENQYRVGDFVEISEVSGTVETVTIRTTILRDLEGNIHHVPNGSIIVTTNKTIGFSSLNENIVLASGTDVELVEHLINHTGQELAAKPEFKSKIQEAPNFAGLNGYQQGGISVRVVGTVNANDKYHIKSEFYRILNKAFDKHHIETISFPVPAAGTSGPKARRSTKS